jgi:tellurite resistance protein
MPRPRPGDRREALESEFFRGGDRPPPATAKQSLSRASGITDDAVLERLVEAGIGSQTLAALSLVPLVEVAWADGSMDPRERAAILEAAAEAGIGRRTPAYDLLAGWLEQRPGPALGVAWCDYVSELCSAMSADSRASLRHDLLGRARTVARAAGGILGVDARISADEQRVLDSLEKAFG